MKKKQLLTMAGSLALVGAIGVGATLAYLTDKTGEVKNTFTIGQGLDIVLDESVYGVENQRTEIGNNYDKVLPSIEYEKDPTVTVKNTETKQYVFMSMLNSNTNLTLKTDGNKEFSENWKEMDVEGTPADVRIFVYVDENNVADTIIDGTDDQITDDEKNGYQPGIQLPALFDTVKVNSDVEAGAEFNPIKIKAAAVQAEGFADENEAVKQVLTNLGSFTE